MMLWDILALLDRYVAAGLGMKRKRDQHEGILTGPSLRPDFCGLVCSALLFKGEEKSADGKLEDAVTDLRNKMKTWSQCYHGQVSNLHLASVIQMQGPDHVVFMHICFAGEAIVSFTIAIACDLELHQKISILLLVCEHWHISAVMACCMQQAIRLILSCLSITIRFIPPQEQAHTI